MIGRQYAKYVVNYTTGFGYNSSRTLTQDSEDGAMLESFGDIFGTMIERDVEGSGFNWLIGEDMATIRNMANPKSMNPPRPDTYEGDYWVNPNGLNSRYINCNVMNYWFYLLAQGGSGTNDKGDSYNVQGIGINNAMQIVYKTFTTLHNSHGFSGIATKTIENAEFLFDENVAIQVCNAWYAVGVGNAPCATVNPIGGNPGGGNPVVGNTSTLSVPNSVTQPNDFTITFNTSGYPAGTLGLIIFDNNNTAKVAEYLNSTSGSYTVPTTGGWATGTCRVLLTHVPSGATIDSETFTLNQSSGGNTTSYCGGGVTDLTAASGSFSDGSGVNDYGNDADCFWFIQPPGATTITLDFTAFDTEAGHDWVKIYDGASPSATLLQGYSGSGSPSSVTSTGGIMLVHFTSNASVVSNGWNASWTSVGQPIYTASFDYDHNISYKPHGTAVYYSSMGYNLGDQFTLKVYDGNNTLRHTYTEQGTSGRFITDQTTHYATGNCRFELYDKYNDLKATDTFTLYQSTLGGSPGVVKTAGLNPPASVTYPDPFTVTYFSNGYQTNDAFTLKVYDASNALQHTLTANNSSGSFQVPSSSGYAVGNCRLELFDKNNIRKNQDVNFDSHSITTTADGASSVYAVDVDGDGDMDVVSASMNDDKIAWHENDGNKNFTTHAITTAADGAFSVYAADVDGDGDMDVLSASMNDDKIAWYENDGNQNFSAHTITTTADDARSVYAVDVDGDGDMDVLSASNDDDKIAWYENDGNQNFSAQIITTAANGANSVYAADLDGDGDMDVLSASELDNKIAWYENDGNQNFTPHTITTTADGARSVYAADVDGDGDLDVLSASLLDEKIAWYENDGNQNFTTHAITTTARGALSVYAIDLDGDGDMDVLSASFNDDKIAWYENDGNQNFSAQIITTAANSARSVHAADLDGDGDMDVLSASVNDDKIAWYENDGGDFFDLIPSACESIALSTDSLWIDSIGLGDIQNQTEDDEGFGDYIHISTVLTDGMEITLKPGFNVAPQQGIFWSVWIDFNQDGDFDDNGELSFQTEQHAFLRGDANDDGQVNMSDMIFIYNVLFQGGGNFANEDAADVNDDGMINITDGVFLSNYLFAGTVNALPEPFLTPGIDPTPDNLGVGSLTGTINVPVDALEGETKMRIQAKVGVFTSDACEVFTYGEVEDYTVELAGGGNKMMAGDEDNNTIDTQKEEEMVTTTVMKDPEELELLVKAYPNPATDFLNIHLEGGLENSFSYQVIDLAGQLVSQQTDVYGQSARIDVSQLPKGIYMVMVQAGTQQITNKVIVR